MTGNRSERVTSKVREFLLVLTAVGTKDEAQAIADNAIDKQLAAAVQVIGPITSTYRWKNQKETAEEWLCLIKTSKDLYQELEQSIQISHSYELPGILALPVIAGSKKYLEWYEGELLKTEPVKEQMLRLFNSAHERLILAATSAEMRGIVRKGEWGPREVLAHIIGWESEATARIPRLAAGEPPVTYDDDAINFAVITALGNQSFEDVRATLRSAHQRLIDLLKEQEDAVFTAGHSVYQRVAAMTQHSNEHAQKLEEQQ